VKSPDSELSTQLRREPAQNAWLNPRVNATASRDDTEQALPSPAMRMC